MGFSWIFLDFPMSFMGFHGFSEICSQDFSMILGKKSSCRGMAVSERWVRPLNYAFTSLAGEGEVGVEMTGCSIQIVFLCI
jgi:hypothetical protein